MTCDSVEQIATHFTGDRDAGSLAQQIQFRQTERRSVCGRASQHSLDAPHIARQLELTAVRNVCHPMIARFLSFCIYLGMFALVAYFAYPYARHVWDVMELMKAEMPPLLPVPVEGVNSRRLANTWHAARSGGRRHEGIDIFAKCGTPVLSATRGLVTRVGNNNLGGQTIWVMGPGGYRHYYAHLQGYGDKARGDWVAAGDVIGFVGNTGNARGTPCHLHYGIYQMRGGAINPYPLLRAP